MERIRMNDLKSQSHFLLADDGRNRHAWGAPCSYIEDKSFIAVAQHSSIILCW